MCEHWECPYRYCPYHEYYDDDYDDESLPATRRWAIPDVESGEDYRKCMSYLDR